METNDNYRDEKHPGGHGHPHLLNIYDQLLSLFL